MKGTMTKARKAANLERFGARARGLGAIAAKVIRSSTIRTAPWVRLKCRYGCDGYGSSLCCPPSTPTPDEMKAILASYRRAVLFEARRGQSKRIAAALEREIFLVGFHKAFGLGAGPCDLCDRCRLELPCRHPDDARPSMEACGIDVFGTVRRNGFTIEVVRHRRDRQHYFGMVLID